MENKEKSKEEMLNELRYMQQLYSEQYNDVNKMLKERINLLNSFYIMQDMLENFDLIEKSELILPLSEIGFARSQIKDSGKLLVNVGAGFLVEENMEDAKMITSKYIAKENLEIEKLQKNKKELEEVLTDVLYNMNLLTP